MQRREPVREESTDMAVSLAQFVRIDENIVKMPKVALVNSEDSLPPKTRTLDTEPLFPPPTNIGEIGNYPHVPGDPTPIGDEKFDADNPPNFAVEYMVYVSDEGSGINASLEEGFELIDGFTEYLSAVNMGLTTRDPQEGIRSLKFDKIFGNAIAGVEKSVQRDFTDYVGKDLYFDIYFTAVTDVLNARLHLEDGSGNVRSWIETGVSAGWNTITLDFDNPNDVDDPGFDVSDIVLFRWSVEFVNPGAVLTDIELDAFRGTDILSGKIAAGDMKVRYARNSAWQTRFEFSTTLNRWALLDVDLGEISNDSPRLQIPTKYTNDWANRAVDFQIEVAGNSLTVIPVPDETFFTNPPAGTVEFALAETTFNFSTSDLATYEGRPVYYLEVSDGEATIDATGVAPLERNINMTFQANPELAKKDLALNHSLVDEIVTNELSATKEIRISFVPVPGTTSLRYDPVPPGAPDPLVEGTDFVIDDDIPAILFTSQITGEVILSDFDVNPQNPGDPDSSQNRYDQLPLNNTDIVANSVFILDTITVTPLVEDQDFMVDLASGLVYLTHGLVEETLFGNVFIPDTSFVEANFTLYINAVEQDSYTLVPDVGWINIDRPLLEGDVPTVDYVSENDIYDEPTQITGEYVLTPGVDLSAGREINPTEPADGGEFSFTVQHPPIQVSRFEVDAGATEIVLEGDRTADYNVDALLQMNIDYYQISSVVYDATANTTTIGIGVGARVQYINPTTFYSKFAPSWVTETTAHDPVPEGVSNFLIVGGADLQSLYYEGIFIRVAGDDVYAVQGSTIDGADLRLQLGSNLTQSLGASDTFDRTTTPIPRTGDEELRTFYTPILAIPDRYAPNGDLLTLDERFPGLGNDSVRVFRNGTEITRDFDYEISSEGRVTLLRDPISATDDDIVIRYVPYRQSNIGDELVSDYVFFSESESGVGLRATLEYVLPDTFYFRVVNDNTQAVIYRGLLEELIRQKTGQVSSGSSPTLPAASGNHEQGMTTPITTVGDRYDNDLIAQRIYEFYDERIGYIETEKMELCGEVVGGYTGPLTEDDVESNALGSGRTFPTDEDIVFAIEDKDSDELLIPARPYRVPALFGMAVEDDISRIVRDKDYPTLPVTTFPPFPPQGKRYKGANQEPNLWGLLGIYSFGAAASAPTTFIENWYPGFLDNTYTNPFTTDPYITYTVSPAAYDPDVQDVIQDTGQPSTATPIFPPADKDLDPDDFQGFNVASFPLPTYDSAAPRDHTHVPPSYEGAAIGALQEIDDEIEAGNLAGYPHRETIGDPTSYPTSLGWVYRDSNEYDLLTNGTVPADTELAQLQAQWAIAPAGRSTPAVYQTNIEQQLLVLNIQNDSLQRQVDALDALIVQIDPAPTGDPELTTITEGAAAKAAAETAQIEAGLALVDAQAWYDNTIIGGDWSDAAIIARWYFLTGVDATGTPSGPGGDPLPTVPVTGPSRVLQVEARIQAIVDRLREINETLGFDNTQEPTGFSTIPTSENLYTTRYTWLDQRLNRESGTLFFALQAHYQYVKDINESESLSDIVTVLGG